MMAGWWLDSHPDFEPLDGSSLWLAGFCQQLKENELHSNDAEHLQELITWNNEMSKGIGGGEGKGGGKGEDRGNSNGKRGHESKGKGGCKGENNAGTSSQIM
jgi:hypothetical protein